MSDFWDIKNILGIKNVEVLLYLLEKMQYDKATKCWLPIQTYCQVSLKNSLFYENVWQSREV